MLGTYECEQEKSSPGLICHVMRQGAVGHLHRHGAMAGRNYWLWSVPHDKKMAVTIGPMRSLDQWHPSFFGLLIQFDEIYVYEYVYVYLRGYVVTTMTPCGGRDKAAQHWQGCITTELLSSMLRFVYANVDSIFRGIFFQEPKRILRGMLKCVVRGVFCELIA